MGENTLALYAVGLTTGVAVGALAASYQLVWRQRLATWGATPDEVVLPLPGDELGACANLITTRAIAIVAPPSCVWPWLVQMGSGRAGTYSYDWVENLLGMDMHSANVILPQFQDVSLGDEFPLGTRSGVMRIAALEPERQLAFSCAGGRWVTSYTLFRAGEGTRLVSRNRVVVPASSAGGRLARALLMEPGWMVFERRMLLGIKDRAERLAAHKQPAAASWRPDSYVWSGDQL